MNERSFNKTVYLCLRVNLVKTQFIVYVKYLATYIPIVKLGKELRATCQPAIR